MICILEQFLIDFVVNKIFLYTEEHLFFSRDAEKDALTMVNLLLPEFDNRVSLNGFIAEHVNQNNGMHSAPLLPTMY